MLLLKKKETNVLNLLQEPLLVFEVVSGGTSGTHVTWQ